MKKIDIRDVGNFLYGHYTDADNGTGTTAIIHTAGATGGVSVQGRAPGTRETDLLKAENTVAQIHGITLSGGSAFGLDAAGGVMRYLEEERIGFELLGNIIPIVPSAILFDFLPSTNSVYPDASYGYEAAKRAFQGTEFLSGNQGAGTGASVGKVHGFDSAMKSGIGTYAVDAGGVKVGACIAVNAFGDIMDPETNRIIAGAYNQKEGFLDTERILRESSSPDSQEGINTTIGCITTNARITKPEANHLAASAHDGLSRCIRPVHTVMDGDAMFVMAEGEKETSLLTLSTLVVHVVEQAIATAVLEAGSAFGLQSAKDIFKET
ncbi:P1 family peptidase [Salimicrobium flavidum]|uniref:L-aminopeptidase/D-esterase n=1 Tax=Salimicrobium flavidum TaxID=570947 RepID=A0A1N7IJY0_9BACI|nr:P1 family peptidase [Salimicrobium flavidum]SIS37291.1 L-aminopeptidase/D-esterase [Salimicrobium flavidum]